MAHSIFRVYFFSRDGKEFVDSKFNGMEWGASGSCLNMNGEHVSEHGGEKWTDKKGRIARTEVAGFVYGEKGEQFPKPADFGDDHAVLVKWWAPGETEWFWLVDDVAASKIAKQGEKRAA